MMAGISTEHILVNVCIQAMLVDCLQTYCQISLSLNACKYCCINFVKYVITVVNTEAFLQEVDENIMVNGVKSHAEVEYHQGRQVVGINSSDNVLADNCNSAVSVKQNRWYVT